MNRSPLKRLSLALAAALLLPAGAAMAHSQDLDSGLTRAEVREALKQARIDGTMGEGGEIGDSDKVIAARERVNAAAIATAAYEATFAIVTVPPGTDAETLATLRDFWAAHGVPIDQIYFEAEGTTSTMAAAPDQAEAASATAADATGARIN